MIVDYNLIRNTIASDYSFHCYSSSGLTDHGLSKVFGSKISSPHSLIVSEDTYAGIVLGFPELEFSPSEVHVWQRPTESIMGKYDNL